MNNTLISKDSKGKIRVVEISCEGSELSGFTIKRTLTNIKVRLQHSQILQLLKGRLKELLHNKQNLNITLTLKSIKIKDIS